MSKKIDKAIEKIYQSNLSASEKGIVRIMAEADQAMQDQITAFYKKYNLPIIVDGQVDIQAMNNFLTQRVVKTELGNISRIDALKKDIRSTIAPYMTKQDKMLESMAQSFAKLGYNTASWGMTQDAGVSLKFPLLSDRTIEAIVNQNVFSVFKDKALKGQKSILQSQRAFKIEQITRQLELNIVGGKTMTETGQAIDIQLGLRDAAGNILTGFVNRSGMSYQALRILRTETLRAYAAGQVEQMKYAKEKYGIISRLRYVAVKDNRTRPQSRQMDGQISDEQGRFKYPDGNYYFMGQTGHPEWDINDRCTTIPQIGDIPPDIMRTSKGIVPYQTYPEWEKDNAA